MSQTTQMDKLMIYGGGYSSLHYHKFKWNLFTVEAGELEIYTRAAVTDTVIMRWLGPGDHFIAPPGVENIHQFYCPPGPGCTCYEFYWQKRQDAPLEREEIVRLTDNGRGNFQPPTPDSIRMALARARTAE
jgi:hypothetical protein